MYMFLVQAMTYMEILPHFRQLQFQKDLDV